MAEVLAEKENRRLYEAYDKDLTGKVKRCLIENNKDPIFPDNSLSVLKDRYLIKNEKGEVIESPKDLFARVAANIAYPDFIYSNGDESKIYSTAQEFYDAMVNREFMPNSPTLMNAGRAFQQLAACFVVPIPDNIEGIFQAVKETAIIQKSGGGTGFSFDKMRRKGAYISTTHGKSSGPISFGNNLNQATESINQGGFRRGANMGCMSIHHPDILEFIYCKQHESAGRYNNFNISVKATDEFMEAAINDKPYALKWNNIPLTIEELLLDRKSVEQKDLTEEELNLKLSLDNKYVLNPFRKDEEGNLKVIGEIIGEKVHLYAKKVLDEIVELAHNNGEPGILFIDRINKDNPTPHLGEIESTNPCGEQPLLPYEACNLGSINLGKFAKNGEIDYEGIRKITRMAVRFLDNVISMSKYPIDEIEEMVNKTRKIGLGLMGWADMLSQLNTRYDSDKGRKCAEDVMGFINEEAKKESVELAKQRGVFPAFEGSVYDTGKLEDRVRNATRTTIAPTGTIGFISGCSAGIEPYFALSFIHTDSDGERREVVAMPLEKELKKENINIEDVLKEIKKGKNLDEIDIIPQKIKDSFRTAFDIGYEEHVLMQAAFQKHVDNAVSKTINLPIEESKENVLDIYLKAYKTGCKGITIYRAGSRQKEVLTTAQDKGAFFQDGEFINPLTLPKMIPSLRIQQPTQFGNMHVTISLDPKTERAYETFFSLGRGGEETNANLEAIGRLSSLCLRSKVNLDDVISQLDGIGTKDSIISREGKITSLPQAAAFSLKKYCILKDRGLIKDALLGKISLDETYHEISDEIRTGKRNGNDKEAQESSNFQIKMNKNNPLKAVERCPDCESPLIPEEGCLNCSNLDCGFSKC